ncbi:MAG TPA: glycosyltransferase family 4 protein [Sedimentisphaerales bacterium]|nr:glycosyltransferase family 4 protein [Sedimentisphaerales bacterium]
MKIGYILTTFPSLTETFAAREIEALRTLGFDITILAASGPWAANGPVEDPKTLYRPSAFSLEAVLSVSYMVLRYPLALGRLIYLILRLVRSCPWEAVSLMGNLHTVGFFARHLDRAGISHIHAYFLSWPAFIALALSAATRRQFSISAHARDIFVERGAAELKVSRANFVAACTEQGLKQLKAGLPARYHDKLHLSYHGAGKVLECYELCEKNVTEFEPDDNVVIAVGRLVEKKGFAYLIKAFALVAREKPYCRLMIVGDGPSHRQLSELIAELNLEGRVRLLGWQKSYATLRLIRRATLLVAPSVVTQEGDRDGIPNAILEAFASGVPVIASDLQGIREAVKDRQTGLLVEPGNIKKLALTITELLGNRDLQRQLSQKAYEMAAERFDSVKNTKTLAALFTRTK